ncbi:hypothetical protein L249_7668 [Ophiocordyceps polyrhachis-furcata BCC 54312]|uniref:Uncharacterized protein n=1 Tax=Ophiocordyceps polyrhachis-furcata BCC 54312 TaxID=1330021 RepID=A0A367LAC0_9HYPO|nr:hypothetical protein L249_7668 [Ophiocordyceps polyrhachis-furcata BCC 54312]
MDACAPAPPPTHSNKDGYGKMPLSKLQSICHCRLFFFTLSGVMEDKGAELQVVKQATHLFTLLPPLFHQLLIFNPDLHKTPNPRKLRRKPKPVAFISAFSKQTPIHLSSFQISNSQGPRF